MEPLVLYSVIGLIGFVAFFLKGITGTGTSTAIVAFSALVIDPKLAIVLAAFVNVFGGLYMVRMDPVPLALRYWGVIAVLMAVGSVCGAYILKIIDGGIFNVILGLVFLCVAVTFVAGKTDEETQESAPEKASILDMAVGYFAGVCGGFVGVNAPILVGHFGHCLEKRYMRRLLILIFIPAAVAQTGAYVWNGLFSSAVLSYGLAMVPGMVAGVYLGNKAFHRVSAVAFKRILAVFLVLVSLKLIFL